MDQELVQLLKQLASKLDGCKGGSVAPCPPDCSTITGAMGRYNSDLSALAVDSMRQFQKDMTDRDTVRQKMLAQTVLKPGV